MIAVCSLLWFRKRSVAIMPIWSLGALGSMVDRSGNNSLAMLPEGVIINLCAGSDLTIELCATFLGVKHYEFKNRLMKYNGFHLC